MDFKTVCLSPVIVSQALWVAARAARLPEASGERSGTLGQGPERRLLVLGDSSAAGVGVSNQSDALGGQLAGHLSAHFTVSWQVVAKSGATVNSTLSTLRSVPSQPFDLVLVALGVNDTKNGVSAEAWRNGYRRLLSTVEEKFSAPRICVSGMPPLRHFPLLPYPLNDVLGRRAERFDLILQDVAAQRPDTQYVELTFSLDPSNMASDGFHPSETIYREWARRVAALWIEGSPPG